MAEIAKLTLVFVLIVALLRFKVNLGLAMLAGSLSLGLSMGMSPSQIAASVARASMDLRGVTLIVALALIMVLENILRKTGTLEDLVGSLRALFGDNRVVMASMPAIIGLLPSPGGAYFSAPLVEESSRGCTIGCERKSFINYWFRHVWEYVSPLYPGFILTAALAGVSMGELFVAQVAFPLTILALGTVVGFRGIAPAPALENVDRSRSLVVLVKSAAPIIILMLLVIAGGVNVAVALVAVLAGLFIFHRYGPARFVRAVREGVSLKTLFLVLGVLIFQGVVEDSGVVQTMPQTLDELGVPVLAILFLLPFLVGFITGVAVAFVGIAFPLLLPLVGYPQPDLTMLAFAFASGFAGVMFSPVHLCLILTKQYFGSRLAPIYRSMALPQALVVVVALVQLFLAHEVFG
ncbi:MAG: DUF401 family protein [Thermoleophilia bacterium]